mmetsp:Transcript_63341/g.182247  ORF Transcript_63341/g.182247 Transcript_63341/m.182247 type:complete len:210 (-) Transcript_63341:198-827(-)
MAKTRRGRSRGHTPRRPRAHMGSLASRERLGCRDRQVDLHLAGSCGRRHHRQGLPPGRPCHHRQLRRPGHHLERLHLRRHQRHRPPRLANGRWGPRRRGCRRDDHGLRDDTLERRFGPASPRGRQGRTRRGGLPGLATAPDLRRQWRDDLGRGGGRGAPSARRIDGGRRERRCRPGRRHSRCLWRRLGERLGRAHRAVVGRLLGRGRRC